MDTIAIEIRGLTKRYDDRTVVDVEHLDVARGEVLALLGPNGAGKTTIVEMCEGYRRPTSGRLTVLGEEPITARSDWRARIGIVTQETGAFDRLTVVEALSHLGGFYPDPLSIDEALGMAGVLDLRDRFVDQLSGGQRRRLDLACGIVGRPELLFLDEPTTGLDPEVRRRLWGVIDALRSSGVTIVLTTHYLEEAEALADRVAVLDRGRVIALDTPDRLGGRDTSEGLVVFEPRAELDPILAEHRWERRDDGRIAIRTTEPTALVAEMYRHGGEISRLEISRPSLEDVYLRLIDHHDTTEVSS